MGKIGDIWIKLGLKKDEFSKGMKQAGEEVNGSGGLLGKLKAFKVGALAVWGAVAAGAVAMADKFAHTSQRLGDLWDQTTAGLKASWNTFIAAVNSTDFTNLGKKLANSFREAKQLSAMKDAEFEVMNSIELQKSAMKDELALLQIRMRNQKLSQKEREDAAKEYLAKVKGIYEQEEMYRRKYSIQAQNTYLTSAGIKETSRNREALQAFLTSIAPNGDAIQALEDYRKAGNRYQNEAQRQLLEGLREQTGANLATLGKIAEYYQSTNDAQAKELVDAIVAHRQAAGAFNEETRKIQSMTEKAVTGGSGGESGVDKFAIAQEDALRRMFDVVEDAMEDLDKEVANMKPVEFEPLEIVPPDMTEWNEWYEKFKADHERMQDLLAAFRDASIQGFSDAVQELADQFAGLSDINPGRVVQALLTPLADLAVKEGEILIAQGVGIEACKKALEQLNGPVAIAAGAALIAIGAAAKAGLQALANGGARSTSTTTYGGGSSSTDLQTIQTEMTVYVTGRISGSDILISGKKTQDNLNR